MKPQQAVALVLPCPSSPEGSADEQSSREIQGQPMQPLRKPTAPEPRVVEVKHQAHRGQLRRRRRNQRQDRRAPRPPLWRAPSTERRVYPERRPGPRRGPHGGRGSLKRGDLRNSSSRKYAAELRDRVATAPEYMTEIGVGGGLVPASILGENSRALQFADTVQNPNYVTVDEAATGSTWLMRRPPWNPRLMRRTTSTRRTAWRRCSPTSSRPGTGRP